MAFDPSTARPVTQGFDPSTASTVEDMSSDEILESFTLAEINHEINNRRDAQGSLESLFDSTLSKLRGARVRKVDQLGVVGTGRGFTEFFNGAQQVASSILEKIGGVSEGTTQRLTEQANAETALYEKTEAGQSTIAGVGEFVGNAAPYFAAPTVLARSAVSAIAGGALSGSVAGALMFDGSQEGADVLSDQRVENALTGLAVGAGFSGALNIGGQVWRKAPSFLARAFVKMSEKRPEFAPNLEMSLQKGTVFAIDELSAAPSAQTIMAVASSGVRRADDLLRQAENNVQKVSDDFVNLINSNKLKRLDTEQLGKVASATYRKAFENTKALRNQNWKEAFANIEQTMGPAYQQARTPLANYSAKLDELIATNKGNPDAASAVAWLMKRKAQLGGGVNPATGARVSGTANIPTLQKIMSEVGDQANFNTSLTSQLDDKLKSQFAKGLFGMLNRDMDAAIQSGAFGQGTALLQQARTSYGQSTQQLSRMAKTSMGKMLGKDLDQMSPQDIGDRMMRWKKQSIRDFSQIADTVDPRIMESVRGSYLENAWKKGFAEADPITPGSTALLDKAAFKKALPQDDRLKALFPDNPNIVNDLDYVLGAVNRLNTRVTKSAENLGERFSQASMQTSALLGGASQAGIFIAGTLSKILTPSQFKKLTTAEGVQALRTLEKELADMTVANPLNLSAALATLLADSNSGF